MDAMYVILEYYSVWFCFTLHKFLHLTLSDHIMNAIRRINDVETNKLKLKHTWYRYRYQALSLVPITKMCYKSYTRVEYMDLSRKYTYN